MRKSHLIISLNLVFLLGLFGAVQSGWLDMPEQSSLTNPAANHHRLGWKTDGKLYHRTSAGVETEIGAGGGGGTTYDPADPTIVTVNDEFGSPNNASGNTLFYSDWTWVMYGDGAVAAQAGLWPNLGISRFSSGASTNNSEITQMANSAHWGGNLTNNADKVWKLVWVIRSPAAGDYANCDHFVGLTQVMGGNYAPGAKLGIQMVSANGTNWQFVAAKDASVSVATAYAADTSFHTFTLRSDGTTNNKVWFQADGGTEVSMCASGCDMATPASFDPSEVATPTIRLKTTTSANKYLDVDVMKFYAKVSAVANRRQ